MALAADEFRSGGQVFDGEGRRSVTLAGGAGLEDGEFRSGGRVLDADGREVVAAVGSAVRGFVYASSHGVAASATVAANTAGLQAAIDEAQTSRKTLLLDWTGDVHINAAPTITDDLTVRGTGIRALYDTAAPDGTYQFNALQLPNTAPYLHGSVIVQTAPATDGLQIISGGPQVDLADFGIKFADAIKFTNTGHGINVNPGLAGGKTDSGLFDSLWQNIKVYGHDGNHYGFRVVQPMQCTFVQLRSWGGGGVHIKTETTTHGNYGNSIFINPYLVVCVEGTAHGLFLEGPSSGSNRLNFIEFNRPQVWTYVPSPALGVNPPLSTQNCVKTTGDVRDCGFLSPDFENNVSSGGKVEYPKIGNYWTPGGRPRGGGLTNFPSGTINSGTVYENNSGSALLLNLPIVLNPTGAAAATFKFEQATNVAMSSGLATLAQGAIPAGGLAGTEMMCTVVVTPGYFYRLTLVNATRSLTSFTTLVGAG